MILAAFFSEYTNLVVGILVGILGMFVTVVTMLTKAKRQRAEEITAAVNAAITASPNRVVVDPQPFLVKMEKDYVQKDELKDMKEELKDVIRRIENLEDRTPAMEIRLMAEIGNIPGRVIEILRQTKGLLG